MPHRQKHVYVLIACVLGSNTEVLGFPPFLTILTPSPLLISVWPHQFRVSHLSWPEGVWQVFENPGSVSQLLLFCMKASRTLPKDDCGCVNTPLFTQTGSGLDGHGLPTSDLENFLYQLLQYIKSSCSLAKGQFAKKSEQINCFKARTIL